MMIHRRNLAPGSYNGGGGALTGWAGLEPGKGEKRHGRNLETVNPGRLPGSSARLLSKLGFATSWTGLLFMAFGALNLEAAKAQGAPLVTSGVVALVDGETIAAGDFEAFFQRYLRQKLYHGGSREQVRELRSEALDQMILEHLIAREVERRDIGGDQQAVEKQIAAYKQRYGASDSWTEVKTKLPALRQHLYEKSRSDVLQAEIEEIAEPGEADLTRYYEDNLGLFTKPEAWSLSVILVGVLPTAVSQEWREAETKSQDIYSRILDGSDFGAIAKTDSNHESATSNGSLGLTHKGQLAPEIELALEAISVGEATPPIKVLEGYALFKKQGVRPALVQPFALVKKRVRGLYLRERKKQQWDLFTEDLRANAQISINERGDASGPDGANPSQ